MERLMSLLAALVGILAEWALVWLVAKEIAGPDIVLVAALCFAVTAISVSLWRDKKLQFASTPKDCLKFLLITPALGALVFCGDTILGQILHPLTNPIDAAMRTGAFGGALTVVVTPLMEIVAFGSLTRSIVLRIRGRGFMREQG